MHTVGLGRLTSSYTAENGAMAGAGKTFGGKQTLADYSYDNIGNIKTESYKYDGSIYSNVSYTYDSANRLQTEEYGADNVGVSPYKVTYIYDAYGNIKSALRESGALVTSQTYSYSNSAGNDLLTMYNGRTITYDAIGNPLTNFNGTEYTFNLFSYCCNMPTMLKYEITIWYLWGGRS